MGLYRGLELSGCVMIEVCCEVQDSEADGVEVEWVLWKRRGRGRGEECQ